MFYKQKIQAAIFVGLSMISIAAQAVENDFYIAPFGSYLHPDKSTEAFDGFGAGMAVGKEINEHFNVEVRGFWQNYDNDYSCCKNNPNISAMQGDSTLAGGTVDVQWFVLRDTFSPYVVAAVGGMNTHYEMDSVVFGKQAAYRKDTTSFVFESGVGATYQITTGFALRSDIRYRLNTLPSEAGDSGAFHDLTVNFGIVAGV